MKSGSIVSIQLLRAAAALSVLLFHLGGSLETAFGVADRNYFEWGANGVDLFFVISGFIMCYTTRRDFSPGRFFAKRVARVIPLYYALTIAVFAVALTAPSVLNSTTANFANLAKSLAFIPYVKENGLVQPVLFVGWTLNYEMFFYAIFALALLAGRWRVYVTGGLIAATVIAGLVYTGDLVPVRFFTSSLVLEFYWGCLVYVLYERGSQLVRFAGFLWPLGAAALIFQPFESFGAPQAIHQGLPAALVLAGCLALPASDGPVMRWFSRLGDASYSIYLFHAFVVQAFVTLLAPATGGVLVAIGATFIGSFVVTIAVSLATYSMFERPTNNWLRRLLLRHEGGAGRSLAAEEPSPPRS
jgi:peptidoglycan/LPS O-acetylase OafA/YrhL